MEMRRVASEDKVHVDDEWSVSTWARERRVLKSRYIT